MSALNWWGTLPSDLINFLWRHPEHDLFKKKAITKNCFLKTINLHIPFLLSKNKLRLQRCCILWTQAYYCHAGKFREVLAKLWASCEHNTFLRSFSVGGTQWGTQSSGEHLCHEVSRYGLLAWSPHCRVIIWATLLPWWGFFQLFSV